MTKFKFIIPMIMLSLVVGTVLFFYNTRHLTVVDKSTQERVEVVEYLAKHTQELWFDGPSEDDILKCRDLDKDAPIDFFRCNKKYLDCAFKESLEFKEKKYTGTINSSLIVTYNSSTKEQYKFRLSDNCHMTYLPQNLYSHGQGNEIESLWDNINQDIYIDKYYVSNAKVHQWNPELAKEKNYKANLSLSTEQKIAYCSSLGKKLLESHIFDAASFIYDRDAKNNYFYKHKANFKKGRNFLTKDRELKVRDCYRAYVLGCEKLYQFKNFDSMSLTWTGINYALGGYPEVVINRFDEKLNLKSSSMLLDKTKKDHSVGFRKQLQNEKGAFRCMLQL